MILSVQIKRLKQQQLQKSQPKHLIWPVVKQIMIEAYWMTIAILTLLAWGFVFLVMISDLPTHYKAASVIMWSLLPVGLTWYLTDHSLRS